MKNFKVFIDESGHPHQNHPSKHFVLVGCVIEENKQQALKIYSDQIKYKFWGKTDVVFHSEEMGKKVGAFAQFSKDTNLSNNFDKEMLRFLVTAPVYVTAAVIDKATAFRQGWNDETIVRKASESITLDFLALLYGNGGARGRVIYESSGVQRDGLYLKSFNRYLNPSWEKQHPEFTNVREHLTSITFANKLNHDTEMQIADLYSYAVVCKYKQDSGLKVFATDSYEYELITALEKKILTLPPNVTKAVKQGYYERIQGLSYYPTKKSVK